MKKWKYSRADSLLESQRQLLKPLQRARPRNDLSQRRRISGYIWSANPDSGIQAAVIGIAGIFCCIGAGLIVLIVKALVGLRVSEAEEAEGLDIAEHGTSAYADFSVK